MKILLVHNRYLVRGGEDAVVDQERELLRSRGHEVSVYFKDNHAVASMGDVRLAANTVWSGMAYAQLHRLMGQLRPDIVHVHNTLPLISPAVYYAAHRQGIPVVQTLHNYRLLCANGLLMRDGATCEDCVGRAIPWPAVRHACYRGSRAATLAVATSLVVHRAVGTFRRQVGRYIALCQFARQKLLATGLPADRVVVKPNFTPDRHADADWSDPRSGALFVGRFSTEKGVGVLMQAWASLDVDLQVIGPGADADERRAAPASVRFRGMVDDAELAHAMRHAAFAVMPSLVYEGFPMVIAEAFAAGLPVIASRLGALAELIEDGVTGLHFNANDPADLAAKVRWAHAHPQAMRQMGLRARAMYLRCYTPQANYERLMEIYAEASAAEPAGLAAPLRLDKT
jgi:glycosyltransferase involved in cell wall biosynthesis